MAYIRRNKVKGRYYLELVESYRGGGKVKQRVLKYLGPESSSGRSSIVKTKEGYDWAVYNPDGSVYDSSSSESLSESEILVKHHKEDLAEELATTKEKTIKSDRPEKLGQTKKPEIMKNEKGYSWIVYRPDGREYDSGRAKTEFEADVLVKHHKEDLREELAASKK